MPMLTSLSVSVFILASMTMTLVAAQQTVVYVSPASYTVPSVGLTFAVNVTVENVSNLYGWEFKLYYPNSVLNGTRVAEGPFLRTGGAATFFLRANFTDDYNSTHGLVDAICTRMGAEVLGLSGSGTLATVTFKSVSTSGPEVLHIDDVKLLDPNVTRIPCATADSEVTVVPEFPEALILPLLIISTLAAVTWQTRVKKNSKL